MGLEVGNSLLKLRDLKAFRGEKKDPPSPPITKKEGQNPKAEQLSEMQLRHQTPVRDFIRKLKGKCPQGAGPPQ